MQHPSPTPGTTLDVGARGSVGRHVLDGLLAAGHDVRASVRDPRTADLPDHVPVIAADLTDPATLPAALDGVTNVFLSAAAHGVEDVAAAALAAGVAHVVLLSSGSVLLDSARGHAIAEEHRATEDALAGSGLHWTPIHERDVAAVAVAASTGRPDDGTGHQRAGPALDPHGGGRRDPDRRHRGRTVLGGPRAGGRLRRGDALRLGAADRDPAVSGS